MQGKVKIPMKRDKKIMVLAAIFAVACVAMIGTGYAAYTGTATGQSNEIPVKYVVLKLGDNSVASYTETFQFEPVAYDTKTFVEGGTVKTQYKAQSATVTSSAAAVEIAETNGNNQITMKVRLGSAYSSGTLSIQFYSDSGCNTAVGDAVTLSTGDTSVNATFTSATYYCKVTLAQSGTTSWSDNVPSNPAGFSVTFTAEAS